MLAGGTDVYPAHVDRPFEKPVLDISGLTTLRSIVRENGQWRLGGLATWTDVLNADLPPAFDGLKQAAKEIGSIQIQNAGTIGGNLCNASPAADGVPPLLTLDASIELTSARGRRYLPLGEFITGYRATAKLDDELLTAVIVPQASAGGAGAFQKLGARRYLVISIVMAAVRLQVEGGKIGNARVALGACSPVALRLHALEDALVGSRLSDDLSMAVSPAHFEAMTPIDDVRATADYRKDAALELVRRTLCQTARSL